MVRGACGLVLACLLVALNVLEAYIFSITWQVMKSRRTKLLKLQQEQSAAPHVAPLQ